MTIILPHGVLFRGGEEGKIRKNLIENNHIDVIIGLPNNIFFGTNIATIIMVLKQKRDENDVLIIDASKGFAKVGKYNKLRASDIKKIVDVVISREDIDKFSKKVSRDDIRLNQYNLNIPRYVDSSDKTETIDIYASMLGGIPRGEINELDKYWKAFPYLKEKLFKNSTDPYSELNNCDLHKTIREHKDVKAFIAYFMSAFNDFNTYLNDKLIVNMMNIKISKEEEIICSNIFSRLKTIPLIDKYEAYQLLNDEWGKIAADLEIIQTEGFKTVKQVDPNIVTKKNDNKEVELQEGWVGHVIPFDLVQKTLLLSDYEALIEKEKELDSIFSEYNKLLDSFSEEEKASDMVNDNGDGFTAKAINDKLKSIYANICSPEIDALNTYVVLSKKTDKLLFVEEHSEVKWNNMIKGKDGTYSKTTVNKYISQIQSAFAFSDDSFEAKIAKANELLSKEKELKVKIKKDADALHIKTKNTIESLSDEQALTLLEQKWITPIVDSLNKLPYGVIQDLENKVKTLSKKYTVTYASLEKDIKAKEAELSVLIGELTGEEYDMKGLNELKKLLNGE